MTRCPGSRMILRLSKSVKRNGTFEPSAALMMPCPTGSTLLIMPLKLLPSCFEFLVCLPIAHAFAVAAPKLRMASASLS